MKSPLPIIYLYTARQGISGSIRFQKLVFLGQKESKLPETYRFIPYKFGPYSYQLERDLEYWIESSHINRARRRNWAGNYRIDYSLSPKGIRVARALLKKSGMEDIFNQANEITSRYASDSLSDLLQYVYGQYPEYTDESTLDIERLFDESTTSQFAEQDESQIGPFSQIKKLSEREGKITGIDKNFTRHLLEIGSDFQATLERINNTSLSVYWRCPSSSFEDFKQAVRDDPSIPSDTPSEMRTQAEDEWIRGECEKLLKRAKPNTCLFFRTKAVDEKFTVTWESGSGPSGDEVTLYVTEDQADYESLRAALVRYATATALDVDLTPGSIVDTTDELISESLRQTAKLAVC